MTKDELAVEAAREHRARWLNTTQTGFSLQDISDYIFEAFLAGAAWQASQDRALVESTIRENTDESSKYHVGVVANVDVESGKITIVEERRTGSRSISDE